MAAKVRTLFRNKEIILYFFRRIAVKIRIYLLSVKDTSFVNERYTFHKGFLFILPSSTNTSQTFCRSG